MRLKSASTTVASDRVEVHAGLIQGPSVAACRCYRAPEKRNYELVISWLGDWNLWVGKVSDSDIC
jgi:hypothetical protein